MNKSKYSIKKVRRVLKLKSEAFEPATYEVWKVTGPKKFVKYFVSKSDAQSYISKVTDTTLTLSQVRDIMNEVNYK